MSRKFNIPNENAWQIGVAACSDFYFLFKLISYNSTIERGNMKKILLTLGSTIMISTPFIAVVSCSKDETIEETTLNFKSTNNLFSSAKSSIGDINQENFKDALTNATNDELKTETDKLTNMKDDQKILFIVEYNDAKISVDIKVKNINKKNPIVIVNKVYITKKSSTEKEIGKNKTKISLFKKYTKNLLIKMIELSKDSGKSSKEIRDELSKIS